MRTFVVKLIEDTSTVWVFRENGTAIVFFGPYNAPGGREHIGTVLMNTMIEDKGSDEEE